MSTPEHPDNPPPQVTAAPAGQQYAVPDLSDLVGDGKRDPSKRSLRNLPPRTMFAGIGVVAVIIFALGGFFVGRATASNGPSTLAEAVQQASQGKLPCGSSTGTGGAFLTAICNGGAGGGRFGGGRFGGGTGTGAGGTGTGTQNGGTGTGQNGATGRGAGGLFGPGSVTGTITSVSGTSMQVQTRAGTITVALPSGVQIMTNATGSTHDLTTGKTVVITGSADSNGNQTAQRVYVLPTAN